MNKKILLFFIVIFSFSALQLYLVYNGRSRGYKVKIKFTLKSFLNDLHVQKAEEAATESKSERDRRLGLENERGIVELQLFKRIAQIAVLCAVGGINTGIYHGEHLLKSGKRLGSRGVVKGYRITHARVAHVLDTGGYVTYLACAKHIALL